MEQFLGVLGVDRNSFEVFHKDPSRRNVFLQTLEVDKIESRSQACSDLNIFPQPRRQLKGNRLGFLKRGMSM